MPGEIPRRGLGAVSVIVGPAHHVLLVRHAYGELNWELPGGAAEARESAEETARREAREEVGVDIVIERLVGVYWEPAWRDGQGAHHFVFRARLSDGAAAPAVRDMNEISECAWFATDALPRPISDFTVRRIADALADRPAGVWTIPPRTWLR